MPLLAFDVPQIIPADDASLQCLQSDAAIALDWLPGIEFLAFKQGDVFQVLEPNEVKTEVVQRYDLKRKLENAGADYALFGLIIGPGIMNNPLGIDTPTLFGLDLLEIGKNDWFDWDLIAAGMKWLGIPCAPEVRKFWVFTAQLESLQKIAQREYDNGAQSRGLLIKPLKYHQRAPFYVSVPNPRRPM
jgi:hypothetical protein